MPLLDRELEQLLRTFLGGVFVLPVLALLAQSLLAPLLAFLCFYDQRGAIKEQLKDYFEDEQGSRAAPAHGPKLGQMLMQLQVDKTLGYYVFMLGLAFVVAGLVEEFLKFWMVQGACCCGPSRRGCCCKSLLCCSKNPSAPAFTAIKRRQEHPQYHGALLRGWLCHPSRLLFFHRPHANHAFVVFLAVVAGALGFSVMENTAYSLIAPTFTDKIYTAALRSISSTPLHCICGGITGVRLAEQLLEHRQGGGEERGTSAARSDLGRLRTKLTVIFPAVLVHGIFDAQLFLLMILVTDEMEEAHPTRYGVVLPTILSLIVLVLSFVYLRRKLHAMENKMNETRYIHVAVDLESGERLGAVNGDFDDAMDFFGNDEEEEDSDSNDESLGTRKVRSVFDM
ncbi:hypothetical protein BBO99_00008183 [Phytophthora kernoviae]|uniref:Uncharacterized protein n=2 Tax=Phytophthora kernoviae TaxID=325452 RepID=A0A3R7KQL8_9STRA|nr:hypothetical protein G195_009266 [Phytophthora kernoviae 00238/432]KAG2515355.1 hypothetical protein JM16_007746 [Phytophthora kernoviae]KAG2518580.1 hypothetical protein JM18_007553 [Phytophthora kernoviae]RLN20532.1 hypothetical protein BBI17_008116 [Phytophthora kernoviae]RLN75622.1 hypothetical protein BBO99_00008183 [Phytophthora kernoviae]